MICRNLQNMEDILISLGYTEMKLFRRYINGIKRKHFPNLSISTELAVKLSAKYNSCKG